MIIVHNNTMPFWEIVCQNCESELTYQKFDIQCKIIKDEMWYFIKCPVCGCKKVIKKEDLF